MTVPRARYGKDSHQRQKCKRGPFSKASAGLDSAIVQPGEGDRHGHSDKNVRQINGTSTQPIQLNTIQPRKQVVSNPAHGQSLEGAGKKIAEEDHPSGGESDGGRKEPGNVRNFATRVRNCGH